MAKNTDFNYGSNRERTIGDIQDERGLGGPPLLKGSDIPNSQNSVTIIAGELRESPESFGLPAILDLAKPVFGREAWAVNITNLRALCAICKFRDPNSTPLSKLAAKLKGKKLKLVVVMVNNPKEKRMVRSLFVET